MSQMTLLSTCSTTMGMGRCRGDCRWGSSPHCHVALLFFQGMLCFMQVTSTPTAFVTSLVLKNICKSCIPVWLGHGCLAQLGSRLLLLHCLTCSCRHASDTHAHLQPPPPPRLPPRGQSKCNKWRIGNISVCGLFTLDVAHITVLVIFGLSMYLLLGQQSGLLSC